VDLVTCGFSSLSDASIRFTGTGGLIEFPSTGPHDFVVTDATSPNLGEPEGNIDGTFVVGLISVAGNLEQASVTTTDGVFSIDDGLGNTLTPDLD
jgi:hypothetical protein